MKRLMLGLLLIMFAVVWPAPTHAQSIESQLELFAVDYFLEGDESGLSSVRVDELIIVNFPNEIPPNTTYERRINPAVPGSRLVKDSLTVTDEQNQLVNFSSTSSGDSVIVSIPVPEDIEAAATNYQISYRLVGIANQEKGTVLQFNTGGLAQSTDLALTQVHVPTAQLELLDNYQSCSVSNAAGPCSVDTRDQTDGRAIIYSVSGLNANAYITTELEFTDEVLEGNSADERNQFWTAGAVVLAIGFGYWYMKNKANRKATTDKP